MRKSLFIYGLLGFMFNNQLAYGQSVNPSSNIMGNKSLVYNKSSRNNPRERNASKDAYVSGEILVKFKQNVQVPNVSNNESKSLRSASALPLHIAFDELGVKIIKPLSIATPKNESRSNSTVNSNTYKISFDTTLMSTDDAIKYMKKLDEVLIAEPNYIRKAYNVPISGVSNPLFSQQWAIQATRIEELWKVPTITNKRPVIAIIDTGLDIDHEEFSGNLWINEAEANGKPGVDEDGNGYIDDINGFDMVAHSGIITDSLGHGTHCAGIAAAKDNNRGIIGMNPDALIMPVRVLNSAGHGETETIIEGLNYAVANGADVISLSLGGYEFSEIEYESYKEASKHAIIVAAAGNDGLNITSRLATYPGAFPSVLGVMSSDSINNISNFSNRDEDGPFFSDMTNDLETFNYELYAPGSGIVSTTPLGYNVFSGTSMATPCVAGIISRLLQCKKYDDRQTLKLDLINACKSGCIDAMKAYEGHKKGDFSVFLLTIQYTDEVGEVLENGIKPGTTVYAYPIYVNLGDPVDNIKVKFSDPEFLFITNGEMTIDHIDTYDTIKVGPVKLEIYDEIPEISVDSINKTELFIDDSFFHRNKVSFNVITTIGEETTIKHNDLYSYEEYDSYYEVGIIQKGHTTIINGMVDVTESLFIPEGDTLIIRQGSIVNLGWNVDFICEGEFICEFNNPYGINDYEQIILGGFYAGTISFKDTLENIRFENLCFQNDGFVNCNFKACEFVNDDFGAKTYSYDGIFAQNCSFDYCKISCEAKHLFKDCKFSNSTLTNLIQTDIDDDAIQFLPSVSCMEACNCYNNKFGDVDFSVGFYSDTFVVDKTDNPSYLGSASDDVVKKNIIDSEHHENPVGKGIVDISNKLDYYSNSAPPILLHVYINGYDIDLDSMNIPVMPKRSSLKLVFSSPIDKNSLFIYYAYNMIWESDTVVNAVVDLENQSLYFTFFDKNKCFSSDLSIIFPDVIDNDDDILILECQENGRVKLAWDQIKNTQSYNMINVYGITRYGNESQNILLEQIPIDKTELTLEIKSKYYAYFLRLTNDDEEEEDIYNMAFDECSWNIDEDEIDCKNLPVDLKTALEIINHINEVKPITSETIINCYDFISDGDVNIQDFVNVYNTYREDLDPTSIAKNAEYIIVDSVLYVSTDIPISAIEAYFEMTDKSIIVPQSGLDNMEHFVSRQYSGDCQLLAYSFDGSKVPAGVQPLLKFNGDVILKSALLCDQNGNEITLIEGDFVVNPNELSDQNDANLHYYNIMGKEVSPNVIDKHSSIFIQSVEHDGKLKESTKIKIIKR